VIALAREVHHTTDTNGSAVGFHRIAVIEGSARRRRFSPEEKARIVAESLDPAVSVSAVAHRHGINPNQLFTWRRQLRAAAARGRAAREASRKLDGDCDAGELEACAAADVIEIVVGGVMIRVRSGVNTSALRRVLSVLETPRC
jgi:transposase